jgi:cell division protein FtsQ
MRDRARVRGRGAGAPEGGRKAAPKQPKRTSEARLLADARRTQRESRLSAQQRGRRLRIFAVVFAVILLLVGCSALYNSNLFAITRVEVVGNVHVSTARVLALAHVSPDATLIRFPADSVAAGVATDPWVADVSVTRVFPSGMRIRVTERSPLAIVNVGPAGFLADGTGMIIATATVSASGTLPAITDVPGLDLKPGRRTVSEPLLNALAVLAGIDPALAASVQSVTAPSVDGTALLRKDRVEIVMGQAIDLAKKSALAETILAQQKGKVVSIDVRITDRPTWRGLGT